VNPTAPRTLHPKLEGRYLYLCTPDRPDLPSFVEKCIAGGVDVVQLREKNLDDRTLLARAILVIEVCRAHGVPFILNDRPDLALECGADGVHVGQEDAPAQLARNILGPKAIVGLSTHSPSELDLSLGEPVDYISVGPVVETPTKPGRPGTGNQYVGYARDRAGRRFFVTGGVSPQSIPGLSSAGADGFVVVRYLTQSDDPQGAARQLRSAINHCLIQKTGAPEGAPVRQY